MYDVHCVQGIMKPARSERSHDSDLNLGKAKAWALRCKFAVNRDSCLLFFFETVFG